MQLDYDSSRPLGRHTRTIIVAIGIALLCLLLPACARNDTLPKEVTEAFEIAFTKRDLPGCVALFTEDAQILPEHGAVIVGRAEIEKFLQDSITPLISYKTDVEMTLVHGDLAVEQGHYTVRNTRLGADVELGKYMHVWRKIKGQWRIYRVIYNTDVSPKGEVSVESTPDDTR